MLRKHFWIIVCLLAQTVLRPPASLAQNCITCTSTHTTLSNGLVLCLPLNGGVINDQSQFGFAGTAVNGPGTVTDRHETPFNAYAFNGTNMFLKYGDILDTLFCKTPEAKFTVSGWAKTTALSMNPNIGTIVAKQANGGGPNEWSVYQHSDGTIRGRVHSSVTDYVEWKSIAPIPLNEWVHFVLIFDGSNPVIANRVVFYINAFPTAFSGTGGTLGKFCANSSQEITIGASHSAGLPNTPNSPYNGAVDDIRIYNRVLTANEIKELYNGTPLQITKMPDVGVCIGDSVQLSASPGATSYAWFPSANLNATNIINPYCKPTANRTYFVTITNGTCFNKDTVLVTLNQQCCVLSQSIGSKNNNLLYYLPINNDARDVSAVPATPQIQGTGTQLTSDRFANKNSSFTFANSSTDKLISSPVPKLSFPANQSFTISLWTNVKSIRSVGSRLISIFKNGGYELILAPTLPAANAGKIEFHDYDGATSTTKISLFSDSAIKLNQWTHISLTVDKNDSTSRLFINGRLAGSAKGLNSVQNTCGVSLGNHNLIAQGLDGALDEIRIYNYALNQNEITDLFYKGRSEILNPDTTICSGDSVQIRTFGNASAYAWTPVTGLDDPTSPNPVARPMTTTSYVLTSTNGGCTFRDTLIIYVNYAEANAGTDTIICKGDSIRLNGSGGAIYSWSPSGSLSNPVIANPYAKPLVDTDFILTVSTASCISQDTVHVEVNDFIPEAGPNLNVCFGDSVQLNATGGSVYAWNATPALSAVNISNPWAKPAVTTTFTVQVTNGFCNLKDSVKLTVIKITPDAGLSGQICPGDSLQLNATGGSSYSWINNGFISDTAIANPFVKPTVNTIFYVYAKIGSCAVPDSVEVIVKSNLTTNAGADDEMCEGESVQLNANGGTQFTWTPATGLDNANIPNPIATPSATTEYIVLARSGNCIAYDTVVVTVNPLPVVEIGNDTTACLNQPFLLTPTIANANTFAWSPASVLDNALVPYPNALLSSPIRLYLHVSNSITGCAGDDSVWVDISNPKANFHLSNEKGNAPLTVQTVNQSGPTPMTYLWTFGDITEFYSAEHQPKYTFETPGNYLIYLTATDQYGCAAYDTATVQVFDVLKIYIPNAFTPNGDRNNEQFIVHYPVDLVQRIEGIIWNKWGQEAYHFNIPGDGWWDGNINGNIAPEGVYFYEILVLDSTNRQHKFKGSLTLLR